LLSSEKSQGLPSRVVSESPLPPPPNCPLLDCFAENHCEWVNPTFNENGCPNCGTWTCTCDANEDLLECSSHCSPTCENPIPQGCNSCVTGCFCKAGLFRTEDERCVTWDRCAGAHSCPPDQEWTDGNSNCQRRCDSPDPMPCPRMRAPGCVCKSGLVLLDDGRCVTPDQCPVPHGCQGDGQMCGGFEAIRCPQGSRCVDNPLFPLAVDGVCQCNVACPIMDCVPPDFCEWEQPSWDDNGCQTSCGTFLFCHRH
jgi:hypothetical protein